MSRRRMRDAISSISRHTISDATWRSKNKNMARDVRNLTEEKMLDKEVTYNDLTIQFIGASGLPRMDVVGSADPYFVADLNGHVSMVSTVKVNTLQPVWNELWKIKNVPSNAKLRVQVWDKDNGKKDDYIGTFTTNVEPGAKEEEIEGHGFRRTKGTFWLKIESTPSTDRLPERHRYAFDGPIRFSRHLSPTIGRLANINDARLYSTWKMYIKGIELFFGDEFQSWNREHKAAQAIFGGSLAIRTSIQAAHKLLYARRTTNGFGIINDKEDMFDVFRGGKEELGSKSTFQRRIKPAVYTYIISASDDSFRFSETGATFFVDFASKHALHSNCAERVRYSGEFHPRPQGGWQNFGGDMYDSDVPWELVIDNNSGTYAPDKMMLPALKACMEYNFPGFRIIALDFKDPTLKESVDACRAYALNTREVRKEFLWPHMHNGDIVLRRR
ncbi:hypothetical protein BDM02DRAFT_3107266 [Thelephora ganbajun]|uniref:Uncharacterized protein n=1 Tax=Thelephora ganbajun TaxID=370292 RepID=A0ACB6ZX67_THEGA|nr:hypothetical protein BDM02DRAFT_3107266 [Thelephora ganbajun]